MKKRYILNGKIYYEEDLTPFATESGMSFDDYLKESGATEHKDDNVYIYKDKEYKSDAMADFAKQSDMPYEDYLKEIGAKKKDFQTPSTDTSKGLQGTESASITSTTPQPPSEKTPSYNLKEDAKQRGLNDEESNKVVEEFGGLPEGWNNYVTTDIIGNTLNKKKTDPLGYRKSLNDMYIQVALNKKDNKLSNEFNNIYKRQNATEPASFVGTDNQLGEDPNPDASIVSYEKSIQDAASFIDNNLAGEEKEKALTKLYENQEIDNENRLSDELSVKNVLRHKLLGKDLEMKLSQDEKNKAALYGESTVEGYAGKDIDNYTIESLELAADPNDKLAQTALKKYKIYKGLDNISSTETRLDDAAVELMADASGMGGLYKKAKENGMELPNVNQGELVDAFLNDPVVIEKATTDPNFRKLYEKAAGEMEINYPDYAEKKVATIISQAREDKGYNNPLINIPTESATDELVDDLVLEGKLTEAQKKIYQQKIRPTVGVAQSLIRTTPLGLIVLGEPKVKTADLISGSASGVKGGFEGAFKGFKTLVTAPIEMGTEILGRDNKVNRVKDRIQLGESLDALAKNTQNIVINPNAVNAAFEGIGNFTTFGAFLMAGGAALEGVSVAGATAHQIGAGLVFSGMNSEKAKMEFPDDPLKRNAYTAVTTLLDMNISKVLPFDKIKNGISSIKGKDIAAVVNDLSTNRISLSGAKEKLGNIYLDYAKKVVGSNVNTAAVLTGLSQYKKMIDATFGVKNAQNTGDAVELIKEFKSNFLSGTVLSAIGAAGQARGSNKLIANNLLEMSYMPETYRAEIEKQMKLHPEKRDELANQLSNLYTLVNIRQGIEESDLNQGQKEKYILNAIQAKVFTDMALKSTDQNVAQEYEAKAQQKKLDNEKIYKGEDKADEFQSFTQIDEPQSENAIYKIGEKSVTRQEFLDFLKTKDAIEGNVELYTEGDDFAMNELESIGGEAEYIDVDTAKQSLVGLSSDAKLKTINIDGKEIAIDGNEQKIAEVYADAKNNNTNPELVSKIEAILGVPEKGKESSSEAQPAVSGEVEVVEEPTETKVSTDAVAEVPKQKEVETLRAEEQAELDTEIENAEQYRVDGKVDRTKLTKKEDIAAFDKIYNKYDKLITPLLKAEAPAASVDVTTKALEDINNKNADVIKNIGGNEYYHGTSLPKSEPDFTSPDRDKGEGVRTNSFMGTTRKQKSPFFFITSEKSVAKDFANAKEDYFNTELKSKEKHTSRVIPFKFDENNSKVLDLTKDDYEERMEELGFNLIDDYGVGMYDESMMWEYLDDPKFAEKLNSLGYDAVKYIEPKRGVGIAVLNTENVIHSSPKGIAEAYSKGSNSKLIKSVNDALGVSELPKQEGEAQISRENKRLIINPKERTEWKGYKVGDIIDGNKLDELSGDLVGNKPGEKFVLIQTPLSGFTENRNELLSQEKGYEQEEIDRLESMKSNFEKTPPIPNEGDGMHRIIAAKELGHETILQWKNVKDVKKAELPKQEGTKPTVKAETKAEPTKAPAKESTPQLGDSVEIDPLTPGGNKIKMVYTEKGWKIQEGTTKISASEKQQARAQKKFDEQSGEESVVPKSKPQQIGEELLTRLGVAKEKTDAKFSKTSGEKKVEGTLDGKPATFVKLPENVEVVDGFYSPIEKRLAETKIEKQSANKWKEVVGKGDEAKFTGVLGWLESLPPTQQVSKSEVQNWMKENRIEINEVVKESFNYSKYSNADIKKMYVDRRGDERDVSRQEMIKWLEEQDSESGESNVTKYGNYQLPGEKTNYKEVLITIPSKTNETRLQELIKKKRDRTITEQEEVEFDNLDKKLAGNFQSSHYDEPNILAHIRMNTRGDAQGNKVLHIEEFQSDWGQKGKKEGFSQKRDVKDIEILNDKRLYYDDEVNAYKHEVEFKMKGIDEVDSGAYYPSIETIDGFKERVVKAYSDIFGIPTAPFVTKTADWTKLAWKVAIKEAVKQGADKITWTTGEQQMDRYDLRKLVDEILWKKNTDGTYAISANKNGNTISKDSKVTPKKLAEEIGKDAADKIISSTEDNGVLKGDDLAVGGKGMLGFYGSPIEGKLGIVGEVVKSLTKQEPKTTELVKIKYDSESRQLILFQEWLQGAGEGLYTYEEAQTEIDRNSDLYKQFKKTGYYSELQKAKLENNDVTMTQPSIDVTPEMKAQVEQGLPKFSKKKIEEDKEVLTSTENKEKEVVSQMNSMNLVNKGIDLSSPSTTKEKIDVNELNSRLDTPLNTIKWKDYEGIPFTFTISDQLRAGDVKNPNTGETITDLKGGIGFNGTKGNENNAWANTTKEEAESMLQRAKDVYENNKPLFEKLWKEGKLPDGHIPMAVVKMAETSILSNEAVFRAGIQNIETLPKANRRKAVSELIKSMKAKISTETSSLKSGVDKNGKPYSENTIKAKKKSIAQYKKILDAVRDKKYEDIVDVLKDKDNFSLPEKAVIANEVFYGSPTPIGGREIDISRSRPNTPVSKALIGDKNPALINLGKITDLLTEPSIKNVPNMHIVSVVGVDVKNGKVNEINHTNYPYGVKGKSIGVLENPVHMKDAFGEAYGSALSQVVKNEADNASISVSSALSQGIPVQSGLPNRVFKSAIAKGKLDAVDKLSGFLRQAFPNTTFFTSKEAWDAAMADPSIKKQLKDGDVVYAFTRDGNIFINPELKTTKATLHETGHIWTSFVKENNAELHQKGLDLVSGTKEYEKAKEEYGDTELAKEEALMELMSSKGETILNAAQKAQFKEWLLTVYKYIAENFKSLMGLSPKQIENLTLDKFLEGMLSDILSGKELTTKKFKSETKFSLESQKSKIKEYIDSKRKEGETDADIKAGIESVADKLNLSKEDIDSLMGGKVEQKETPVKENPFKSVPKTQAARDKYFEDTFGDQADKAKEVYNKYKESGDVDLMMQEMSGGEGVPPTINKGNEISGSADAVRGITMAANEERRKDFGMPERQPNPESFEQWDAEAAKLVKDGYDMESLIKRMEKGIPSTPVENSIKKIYQATLDAQIKINPTNELLAKAKRFIEATEVSSSQAGKNLVSLKGNSEPLSTITDFYVAKMEANGVSELTEEQKKEVQKQFNMIDSANKIYEKKLAEAEAKNAELLAQNELLKKQAESKTTQKAASVPKEKRDFKAERDSIKEKLRKEVENYKTSMNKMGIASDGGAEGFVISVKMAKLILDLAKNHVEEVGAKLAEVTAKTFEDVKDIFPGITDKDIHDVIAGKYSEKKQTRNQIAADLRDLRTEAKLLDELDRVLASEPKTEKEKIKKNQRLEELRKQIKAIKKENKLDEFSDEARIAKAEAALEENIKELERKLDENDIEVKKAEKINSPKLEALRETQKELNDELKQRRKEAEAPATPKDLDEARIKRTIEANKKKQAQLEKKLADKDFEPEEKPESVYDNAEFKRKYPALYKELMDSYRAKQDALHEYELAVFEDQMKNRNVAQKTFDFIEAAINTTKKIVTGIDDSALFMQTLSGLYKRPTIGAKAFAAHLRDFISKRTFERTLDELHNSKWWDLIQKSGLDISEPKSLLESKKEEAFSGKTLDIKFKIKGKEYGIVQELTAPFERAFTSLGNNMRTISFMTLAEKYMQEGHTFENNPKLFKDLATMLNNDTGRGNVNEAAQKINSVVTKGIWSPKLMASRLNMLGISDLIGLGTFYKLGTKGYYKELSPEIRKQALYDLGKFVTAVTAVSYSFAYAFGGEVDDDPASQTFLDVKVGNKSYNFAGGFSQYVRLMMQTARGGKTIDGKFKSFEDQRKDRGSNILHFLRGKVTPVTGVVIDVTTGKDFTGQPVTVQSEISKLTIPLSMQSLSSSMERDGSAGLLTTTLPSFVGIGVKDERDFEKGDKFTGEDKRNTSLKRLAEYNVDIPKLQTREQVKIKVDKKHKEVGKYKDGTGYSLYSEEEFKKYNDKKKALIIGALDKLFLNLDKKQIKLDQKSLYDALEDIKKKATEISKMIVLGEMEEVEKEDNEIDIEEIVRDYFEDQTP
jgi:hypothetical protein